MTARNTLPNVVLLALSSCSSSHPSEPSGLDRESAVYAEELATNWSQPGRTPRNTSFNPFESALTAESIAGLQLQWAFPWNAASILKRDDALYASEPDGYRSVIALSAATGQPLWGRDFVDLGISGYTAGRIVTVGLSGDGYKIDGYNPKHGAYTFTAQGPIDYPADANLAPGRLWHDWAYFAQSAQSEGDFYGPCAVAGYDPAQLFGVNLRDGRTWNRYVPMMAGFPSAVNDRLFVTGAKQEICERGALAAGTLALDANTGETLWHSPIGHDPRRSGFTWLIGPAPIVIGGRVFVTAELGTWAALDEDDGSLLWQHTFGAPVRGLGELAASFDALVAAAVRTEVSEVLIEGLDPADGSLLYTHTLAGSSVTRPVIAGDLVYLGVGPTLHVLDLATGEALAQRALGGDIRDLIVADGAVYIAAADAVYRLGLSPLPEPAPSGNGVSSNAAVDTSGRYTVFDSSSSNLVPGDSNRTRDVFLFDAETRSIELISRGLDGSPANGLSSRADIDLSGRYVAFGSRASNLVADDPGSEEDVFLFDRQTQQTRRIATGRRPVVSRGGAFVAFESSVALLPQDTNTAYDVYLWNRQLGSLELISARPDGKAASLGGFAPRMSADGLTVIFSSSSNDLTQGDTNTKMDAFIRDRSTFTTYSIPSTPYGNRALDVSAQGRYVLYSAERTGYTLLDLRVYDRSTGTSNPVRASGSTLLLSSSATAVGRVSENGNVVAFMGAVGQVGDSLIYHEVLVANLKSGTAAALRNPSGARFPVALSTLALTPDGTTVAFDTEWSLAAADTNFAGDVYVVSRALGETILCSATIATPH